MLRRTSAAAVAATVVGGWLAQAPAFAEPVSAPAPPAAAASGDTQGRGAVPAVHPTPQSMLRQGDFAPVTPTVTLVADPAADPYALGVVEQALRDAGARTVTRGGAKGAGLTVYAGAPAEGPLAALKAPPAADLPDGGYRLAVSGGTVALQGTGPDGLFHAAQTLRQLATTRHGAAGFAPVLIRDWPVAPVRGVTEGFYGSPWTQEQRLAQLDFMARTKQNRFLYAPGDDPYRQERWRELYPAAQRADFRALAARAAADHVTLAWALAPGQHLCFSSADDESALRRKLDAMWALGVRAFQVQFPDVSYTEWHCGADARAFGTGPRAAATAQARVANALARYLADRHGAAGAGALSLLPTEFYQDGATDYRTALAKALDQDIAVAWTGVGVLPARITGAQVAAAAAAFGHRLLTVDDYPVNDFATDRLFLGPYTGRQPAVATVSAGLLASAMQQPVASRIALFTAADFAWNPHGYDPGASWQAAVDDLAGPGEPARAALRALAGNEAASALGGEQSAYLRPLIAAFEAALPSGGARLSAAARTLRAAFTVMRTAPQELDGLAGGAFGAEVGPWLDRLARYGAAGEQAVDLLTAQARGDGAAAWRARQALDGDRAALAGGTVTVGGPVLDGFLSRATDSSNAWSGLGGDGRTATTSMASGRGTDPSAMTDGKDTTAWSSAAPPRPGDTFGVDLGAAGDVTSVRIAMGDGSGPDDFLHDAVLEVAGDDGTGWRRVGAYRDRPVIEARLPAGGTVRRVRLRAASAQPGAVTVRDFTVTVSGAAAMTASGPPRAAAAVDGDFGTPAGGGPLTVAFGGARQLDTLTVAARGVPASAGAPVTVEAHTAAGGWRRIGVLAGDWTELRVGALVDAVRVSDGRGVCEVVPWFAGAPRVTLDTPRVDAAAGGPAVRVTAAVTSGLPRDTTVAAAAAPGGPGAAADGPAGRSAAPVAVRVPRPAPLRRGATARVPLTVSVPSGTPPGTYTVPVRFTVDGRTVERPVTVRVHLPAGGPDLVPGSAASSSGDETPDFPAAAVADGDPATRWSSPVDDSAWVQVRLASPARLGKVVLRWQDAYATAYRVQTSADGVTWHTAATVTDGGGGVETVWLDAAQAAAYLRVQGVRRATAFGYSLYGIEAYAVTG